MTNQFENLNEFEKLIRNGWAETASADNFVLPIGRISWKPSKVSVSEDENLILLSTKDERFYVEMRQGMTYFYNPSMWRVKSLDNKDDTNRRKEMTYIYENRSVRHDAGPDMRFQLKEFLMQEVNRAWSENDPCGEISCQWDETSVHVIIKVGTEVRSSVTFDIQR